MTDEERALRAAGNLPVPGMPGVWAPGGRIDGPEPPSVALGHEVVAAVQAVLVRHGLELHGEVRGLVQQPGQPETAIGFTWPVGNGVPPGWRRE